MVGNNYVCPICKMVILIFTQSRSAIFPSSPWTVHPKIQHIFVFQYLPLFRCPPPQNGDKVSSLMLSSTNRSEMVRLLSLYQSYIDANFDQCTRIDNRRAGKGLKVGFGFVPNHPNLLFFRFFFIAVIQFNLHIVSVVKVYFKLPVIPTSFCATRMVLPEIFLPYPEPFGARSRAESPQFCVLILTVPVCFFVITWQVPNVSKPNPVLFECFAAAVQILLPILFRQTMINCPTQSICL